MTTKKGLRIILHMLPYTLEQKVARITDERNRIEFEREKLRAETTFRDITDRAHYKPYNEDELPNDHWGSFDWKCGVSSLMEAEFCAKLSSIVNTQIDRNRGEQSCN